MKFAIITPCYNAAAYICETVESVINQRAVKNGEIDLDYMIIDGGSKDNTVALVQQYQHPAIRVISEPDKGMYHALAKGLQTVQGEICAYINAGDFYSPYAFEIVTEIFTEKDVKWLTGMMVHYNQKAHIVRAELPFKYRSNLILAGFYGTRLNFIQQESTFWCSSMNRYIDYSVLEDLCYAGDYYLWTCFAQYETLKIVEAYLGGFKFHGGQLSENKEFYYREMEQIRSMPQFIDYWHYLKDKLLWSRNAKRKKRNNPTDLFVYDHSKQEWA